MLLLSLLLLINHSYPSILMLLFYLLYDNVGKVVSVVFVVRCLSFTNYYFKVRKDITVLGKEYDRLMLILLIILLQRKRSKLLCSLCFCYYYSCKCFYYYYYLVPIFWYDRTLPSGDYSGGSASAATSVGIILKDLALLMPQLRSCVAVVAAEWHVDGVWCVYTLRIWRGGCNRHLIELKLHLSLVIDRPLQLSVLLLADFMKSAGVVWMLFKRPALTVSIYCETNRSL